MYFLRANTLPEICQPKKEWVQQSKAVQVFVGNSISVDHLNISTAISTAADEFWSVAGGVLKTN